MLFLFKTMHFMYEEKETIVSSKHLVAVKKAKQRQKVVNKILIAESG